MKLITRRPPFSVVLMLVLTGVITWRMRSADPETDQFPSDPLAGFLPVNDATHNGEGYVSFRARPKPGLANNTSVTNTASIVFDTNAPIATNTVTNTIEFPFTGTTARPARNTAEVTIFLDNSSRSAPAEFNDSDIIEITRRIEREAGSAYRINGRESRARAVASPIGKEH